MRRSCIVWTQSDPLSGWSAAHSGPARHFAICEASKTIESRRCLTGHSPTTSLSRRTAYVLAPREYRDGQEVWVRRWLRVGGGPSGDQSLSPCWLLKGRVTCGRLRRTEVNRAGGDRLSTDQPAGCSGTIAQLAGPCRLKSECDFSCRLARLAPSWNTSDMAGQAQRLRTTPNRGCSSSILASVLPMLGTWCVEKKRTEDRLLRAVHLQRVRVPPR
jgi:hypothetical protein